jgi:hypothetical protein
VRPHDQNVGLNPLGGRDDGPRRLAGDHLAAECPCCFGAKSAAYEAPQLE